ncbi:adenylate/guanylate cyclase domain-containing protein [Sphingomonas bacterium]|uniref:adenylate/guanylate cyclase domain-containing protein n=1 Tax=Sphingomonas bacterium TaxID=1895847 RepID=UPI00260223CC|nr:adenylate/guanylate cyclase domain-containing protein [Sphingomonas bacterium]MDB5678859.1 putative adenylate/guanylate cyclase [Sphingomonas bacterium]
MNALRQFRRTVARIGYGRLLVTALLLGAALLMARYSWDIPVAVDVEHAAYDVRALVAEPKVDQDQRIVMVTFNDDTLAKVGRRYPLDRALLARALTNLDRLGAKGIGIDVLIDQATPDDPALIAAMRGMRTPTFLAFATNATNPDAVLSWQEQFQRRFQSQLAPGNVHPASIRIEPALDGVMRSWPGRPPGLPPMLVDQLTGGPGKFAGYDRSIAYRLPRYKDGFVFAELPIDLFDSDDTPDMLKNQIEGRYVLIGGDISDLDRFDTPGTLMTKKTTSGLEIHATMLAQRLDGRMPMAIPSWLLWLMAGIVTLAGAAVGTGDFGGWRLATLVVSGLAVIVLLPFGLQYWGVDTQGLPAFGGLIGWTMAYSAAAALARMFGSEERRFAQGALGRYLPRDVAAAILRDPSQLSLHGERTTIFALFSDLEGFTKLTHAISPETTAVLLNSYLDRLSGIVLAHGGTVDKFVGDAVVAFWGAPIARPDDGDRALAAAIAMVEAGEAFRQAPPADCPPVGRTRVGVHRGEAIVGNFGGEGRMQYTALGDAMNTASRLEGANKQLGTRALVSAEAAAAMTDPPLRPMGRITVRGRSTPIEVYEPVSGVSEDELHLFRKMLRNFDTGKSGALEKLERYAEARDGDRALGTLVENLHRIGPGGCLALD